MIEIAFKAAMADAGLAIRGPVIADGKLHRYHVEGDSPGTKNGYYTLHSDGRAAGMFCSWKTGQRQTWVADGKRLSESERRAFLEKNRKAQAQAEAERYAEQEDAAIEALRYWGGSVPASPEHPYLLAKRVKPHDLHQRQQVLLVPLFDIHGRPWNVQRILADGTKLFLKGRAGGLFSPLGDITHPTRLIICEGWASGATLHEQSGLPVLCAMYADNLLPVAQAARAYWPDADLTIAADNDRETPGNPGLTKATAAALSVGARLAVPEFPDGVTGSDFNDLNNFYNRKIV